MKSPNNTTDIPDVLATYNIDNGLCPTEKKIRKIDILEEKSLKKTSHCYAHVLKS